MLIYVYAPSGRTTGVSIRPSDIVANLKVRIEDEEWISRDRQCLTFRKDKLEDGHTFESYGIGEGATIQLSQLAERDEAYCIYVQRPNEEGTEEEVFPVWIKPSDTIGSLKPRLMDSIKFHGPWRGQRLIFNQQQLEDGYKFSDYNIQESTIIRYHFQTVFLITVVGRRYQHGGLGRIRLEVTDSETIGSLKARLWDGGLIPRSGENLFFDGMCLENRRTLSDYNIQEDTTIFLPDFSATYSIQIRFPTGETIRIIIKSINTIWTLKSRVEAWVPRDMQRLIFVGQELEDKKLVLDYPILPGSTVDLHLPLHMHAPLSYWIVGPINITIKTLRGRSFVICVKGTDTIYNVKLRILNVEGILPDELIFDGKRWEDGRTISDYGIQNDSNLHLDLNCCARGALVLKKLVLELDGIAKAISLWDWDGIMPGPGNNESGLRLSKGDFVTVGRIVNDEWFHGFNEKHICGYFPRAFVSVRKYVGRLRLSEANFSHQLIFQVRIKRSEFKDDIPVDETPIEELQVEREAPKYQLLQILLGFISKFFPSTPPPPDPDRPDLPPSPKPAPPFDRIVDGNRVLVQFSLDPRDNQRNYTLRAMLSLNSAPGARFSGLTFNLDMTDGTILAISPENVVGPETEAEITKDKNHQASLSTSLQAGSAPISASIDASTSFTRAEHITYIRKTRGTVQGNGVGSSRAYWVMKEDNGPAAEQGLGPVFDLMVKLNVRPAIISFEVVAYILCESGKRKTIRSGFLGTSV